MTSAKGVAITLVVIGHTLRGIDNSEIDMPDLAWLDTALYTFHMPLFMVLAGWFFFAGIRRRSFGKFARGKALRILYPMILWTYLFLGTKLLAGQFVNAPVGLGDLMILPIPGVLHFWFLWDLFLLCLVFFPLKFMLRDTRQPLAIWLGLIAGVSLLRQFDLSPELAHWIGSAVTYAPFFLIGAVMGQYRWEGSPRPMLGLAALGVLVLTLAISGQFELAGRTTALIALLACLLAVANLHASLPGVLRHPLKVLGAASMAIYLGHTIFSAAFREVLLVSGIDDTGVHLAIGVAVGLVGPVVLLAAARWFGLAQLLGLETRATTGPAGGAHLARQPKPAAKARLA